MFFFKSFTIVLLKYFFPEWIKHGAPFKIILDVFIDDFFYQICILCWQDVWLSEYPGVQDSWMDVISSQGTSVLSVDLSGSDVTDTGLGLLKECSSL